MKLVFILLLACFHCCLLSQPISKDTFYLLKPDRVFDGEQMHEGWRVLIKNNKIVEVGAINTENENAEVIELKGCTLLPGLIEGHSHLFLHPYNETSWMTRC